MEDEILSLEKAAMERWRNGDPLGFVEISADEISYVDPGLTQPILGILSYRAMMQQIAGQIHYQRSEFIDPRVAGTRDAAVLSYNYRSTRLDPDGSIAGQTPWNVTSVYARTNGAWRIVHAHFSLLQHHLPGQVEIPLTVQMAAVPLQGTPSELLALEAGAMERWRKGDPWGFIDISAPEVTYFDTGTAQRINGREALSAEYKQREGKICYDVMDFVAPHVQVYGDLAVLFYRFLSTWLNPDGSIQRRTPWNCTEVFLHREGQWRIVHTHWSFIHGQRD